MPMKVKEGIKLRKLGHRYMIVMPKHDVMDMSEVISLNESAAYIWNRAAGLNDFTQEQVVEWLLEEYEVDAQTARKDVHKTLEDWKKFGLVE